MMAPFSKSSLACYRTIIDVTGIDRMIQQALTEH